MNFDRQNRSQLNFRLSTMTYFLRFRRFALLLLSLSLSTQAMAVTSIGACHQEKALLFATQLTTPAHAEHHSRSNATHHQHDSNLHHGDTAHDQEPNHSSRTDISGIKCAVCAGCHLCNVVLPAEIEVADIPNTGPTVFLELTFPRVRSVASDLERPPRA